MMQGKKHFQVQLFSGVEHGFALRGDMDNPYERKSSASDGSLRTEVWVHRLRVAGYVKEQSLSGIVAWFDFWLSQ